MRAPPAYASVPTLMTLAPVFYHPHVSVRAVSHLPSMKAPLSGGSGAEDDVQGEAAGKGSARALPQATPVQVREGCKRHLQHVDGLTRSLRHDKDMPRSRGPCARRWRHLASGLRQVPQAGLAPCAFWSLMGRLAQRAAETDGAAPRGFLAIAAQVNQPSCRPKLMGQWMNGRSRPDEGTAIGVLGPKLVCLGL